MVSASNDLSRIPDVIPNLIGGKDAAAADGRTFAKIDPATGAGDLPRGAVERRRRRAARWRARKQAQPAWAELTPVRRGDILRQIAFLMREHRQAIAELVARETGKSLKDALGETDAAIEMGFFVAGEGRRFYGQTTTSAVPNKTAMVVRQPLGVAGLIIAANTPIANVAWKAFPALLCGNAAILKAAEDTPLSAWAFGVLAREAGVPDGVYSTHARLRRGGRRAARGASRRGRGQLHRLVRGRALDCRRRRASGWPRRASSSAARTRSSSATTPTWRTR